MASGTINGSTTYQKSYMSFGVNWSSVSNGADANTSTLTINTWWQTTNTSKKWDTVGQRTGNYVNIYINGTLVVNDTWSARFNCDPWSSNPYIIRTTTYVVQHNNDGTPPTIEIEAYANGTASSGGKQYGPGSSSVNRTSITIDNIPRYPTINQSLSSKTETTISMNWSSDSTINNAWYSIDNGANWVNIGNPNSTNGNYTISNLTANTSYNIKTKLQRADSGLSSITDTLQISTFPYPFLFSMGSFIIGDNPTIEIWNDLGRTCTITLLGDDDSVIGSTTTTGTIVSGLADATKLYASIPNKQSAKCKVKVETANSSITRNGGTYSIVVADCMPSITSASYEDTNNDTLAITSDNQKLISNNSITTINATGLVVKNSATITSVVLTQTDITANMVVSGTSASATGLVIPYTSLSSKNVRITLTDSRNLTATYDLTLDLLQYSIPTATYSIKRESNYYSNTNFLVNANYTNIGSNTLTIRTRQKQEGSSTWGNYTTLTNNQTSVISLDNTYYWDIEIEVSDSLHTTTYTTKVARGMPLMYFDTTKNSLGVNCFPVNNASIELNGKDITKYTTIKTTGNNQLEIPMDAKEVILSIIAVNSYNSHYVINLGHFFLDELDSIGYNSFYFDDIKTLWTTNILIKYQATLSTASNIRKAYMTSLSYNGTSVLNDSYLIVGYR